MPEQPADPLHYEMKIPPEPHSSKDKGEAEKSDDRDREENSDIAKDATVLRGNDKPQAKRGSE